MTATAFRRPSRRVTALGDRNGRDMKHFMEEMTVVHGEEQQSLGFAEILTKAKPQADVLVPVPGQAVEY